MDTVSAILLAAGESKRMGKPKLLLPLGDSTILERAVDNLLNSNLGEVIVVVGYRAREMIKLITNRPVKITINPLYRQGMSTSILKGLSMITNRTQTIMLTLADQPFVDSETINRLLEEFLSHNKGIVIPTYQGKRGHPIIFSAKYKEELLRLKGDVGGKDVIKEHFDDILEVAVNSQSITIDIDTTRDYYSHLKLIQK
ncbi:Nicotine blue oxidoreductase [subsurface metagenome]